MAYPASEDVRAFSLLMQPAIEIALCKIKKALDGKSREHSID
jgi:hypothetical protein